MKKIFILCLVFVGCLFMTGCGTDNMALEDIMDKLYDGISEDEMPMMSGRDFYITLNGDTEEQKLEYYSFVSNIDYKEAVISESASATAHSVVLIRLNNKSDSKKVVEDIKANADPRKWICVEAENVIVKSKGDLVILIMSNELAPKIEKNFDKL